MLRRRRRCGYRSRIHNQKRRPDIFKILSRKDTILQETELPDLRALERGAERKVRLEQQWLQKLQRLWSSKPIKFSTRHPNHDLSRTGRSLDRLVVVVIQMKIIRSLSSTQSLILPTSSIQRDRGQKLNRKQVVPSPKPSQRRTRR